MVYVMVYVIQLSKYQITTNTHFTVLSLSKLQFKTLPIPREHIGEPVLVQELNTYSLNLRLLPFPREQMPLNTIELTSSNVTGSEGDDKLLSLGAVGPGLGDDVLVQELKS